MNLFSRMIFGKDDQTDYTVEDKPDTRRRLFLFVLREHTFGLVLLSLVCTVILLPAEFWVFLNTLVLLASASDPTVRFSESWMLRFFFILWTCLVIAGPALGGVYRVARNWARDQSCAITSVLKATIKDSWKNSLLISIISASIPLLSYFAFVYFRSFSGDKLITAALIVYILICLLWVLMVPCMRLMSITYDLSFAKILWNAVYLTIRHLWLALKIRLLAAVPFSIAFLFCMSYTDKIELVSAVCFVYYIFIGYGLEALLLASYANYLCEKNLNVKILGAGVNIGLRSESVTPAQDAEQR